MFPKITHLSKFKWLKLQLFLFPILILSSSSFILLALRPNPYAYSFSNIAPQSNRLEPLQKELAFYRERLQTQPDGLTQAALASTFFKMAQATGQSHWYLKADQMAQQSLETLPHDNIDAILIRARVAEAKHDFSTAIQLAQDVLDAHANHENALSLLVTSYLAQGNIPQADALANQLLEQTPTLASYTLRSLVDIAQGNEQAAKEHFQLALEAEEAGEFGGSEKLRLIWGKHLTSLGRYREARNLLESALSISPQSPSTLVAIAELDKLAGNYTQAAQRYSQVFQSQEAGHTFDHSATAGRAELAWLEGNITKAQDLWQRAEADLRNHGELDTFGHQREFAELLLTRGNPSDMPEALSLMKAELNRRQDVETLETLAWALAENNQQSEALARIQQALSQGSQSPKLYYRAAAIARLNQKPELAQQYQNTAQALNPDLSNKLLSLWRVI